LPERFGKQLQIALARYLDGAEADQMIGQKLGIEKFKAIALEARHQMHQRDLGGIGLNGKHAFAEKDAGQMQAIEAADQLVIAPGLDRVDMAGIEQRAIEPADFLVDPG